MTFVADRTFAYLCLALDICDITLTPTLSLGAERGMYLLLMVVYVE